MFSKRMLGLYKRHFDLFQSHDDSHCTYIHTILDNINERKWDLISDELESPLQFSVKVSIFFILRNQI